MQNESVVVCVAQLKLEQLRCDRLKPIDLEIHPGECVCISGPSGSGKSTLLRAIADLDPHQGYVYLDGQEQAGMAPNLWRSQVGLLAAESHWWFDELRPHFPSIEQDWFESLDFELNVLDWQVSRLSSGERQRLALLRLLCHHPKVLLLDEPSANLDAENTTRIEHLLLDYAKEFEAPLLWISHDSKQIKRLSQRHYRIESGELQEVVR